MNDIKLSSNWQENDKNISVASKSNSDLNFSIKVSNKTKEELARVLLVDGKEILLPKDTKVLTREIINDLNINNAEEIIIPNGVEEIGDSAFSRFERLKKVECPKSLVAVGELAFANCKDLDLVIFHNEHEVEIKEKAFYNSHPKSKLTIVGNIEGYKNFTNINELEIIGNLRISKLEKHYIDKIKINGELII